MNSKKRLKIMHSSLKTWQTVSVQRPRLVVVKFNFCNVVSCIYMENRKVHQTVQENYQCRFVYMLHFLAKY